MSHILNKNLWEKLLKKNNNCIIFYGNPNQEEDFILNDRILSLKCNDTYDFLPIKVLLMIKAIIKLNIFKDVTHIFKIDDHDTRFNENIDQKLIDILNISNIDYGGQKVIYPNKNGKISGDRKWHFNKVPKDSFWDNKMYKGPYNSWALGGYGYILSRKSMRLINNYYDKNKNNIIKNHIYEDLMISSILVKYNIFPIQIKNIILGEYFS